MISAPRSCGISGETAYGVCTVSFYDKYLNCKADTLHKRDLRLKRPYALKGSKAIYKQKLHAAILKTGTRDPYTGDTLRWDLMSKWINTPKLSLALQGNFSRDFYLLPVVNHADPEADVLEFEICSWLVNASKTVLNPADYIALCKKIAANRG
ncbi:MAG: hypothetical protein PHC61_01895 [Chitinivibrionales bacterium]|nr:hypothetical protein [Chitinivibrionales bacterium]